MSHAGGALPPDDLRALDFALLAVGVLALALRWPLRPSLRWPPSRGLLGWPAMSASGTFYAVFGIMSALVLNFVLLALFPEDAALVVRSYDAAGAPLWLALVDRALLHAVAEEVVLRGVVLAGLASVLRPHRAALLLAVAYGACAPSWLLVPVLALLGYVLGRVRLGSRSLHPVFLLRIAYEAAIVWLQW